AATGALMMFVYQPSSELAYDSVRALESEVVFGSLVRGVHYWCANLVVVVALLHLARVFFTGGFHGLRQFNWIVGIALLVFILASNFTGYLLPWDQLSFWAITICTGMARYVPLVGPWLQELMRGGSEVGSHTLILYYTIHTTIIPILLIGFMAFHFWRVRKAGGVISPQPEVAADPKTRERLVFFPFLFARELAVGLVWVAAVLTLSVLFGAPLGDQANPGMSPNPAKAPWYFVGFQELLIHLHPLVAVVMLPLLVLILAACVPYLRYDEATGGKWFLTDNGPKLVLQSSAVGAAVAVGLVLLNEFCLQGAEWVKGPAWLLDSVVPGGLLIAVVWIVWIWLTRRNGASRDEAIQGVAAMFAAAFVVLTLFGVWFRGPGMALVWPWGG
ncbi:MAG: cytochrome bc complex cytochrome b subunit, partial [bacterium]|nr:cytochrome bc complex cytochrome b subunit [bacterium]